MRTSAALAGPWALLLATPLWAQEPRLDHLGLDELLQIRVSTSTQTPVALQAAPSTIYRYSGDELRRWGMRSLADVVNYLVPGAVLTEDADETIAAFRGVATDNNCKVLVLIDGHAVNVQWAKGATPELELGLLEDVEAVEIIVGPGSALYGSGATVGVLNVLTRAARGDTQASTSAAVGSGKRLQADAAATLPLGGGLSMACSAGLAHAEGFPRRDGSAGDNGPEYIQRTPLSGRASVRIQGPAGSFAARFSRTSRALYNTAVRSPQAIAPYENQDYLFLEGQRELALSPHLRAELSLHADTHQSQRFDFRRGLALRALGERHLGGKARLFWTGTHAELVGGLEYSRDSFGNDWNGRNFAYYPAVQADGTVTGITPGPAARILTPYSRSFWGVYGQALWHTGKGVTLLAGFRGDYVGAPRIREHFALTPRLGLVGTPDEKTVWKLMYTSGFRQAMAILTTPDGYLLGSPAYASSEVTEPERIRSLEASCSRLVSSRFNVSANLFYNRMEQLHSLLANGDQFRFVSAGRVDLWGGELVLWYRLQDALDLRLAHQHAAPGRERQDPSHVILSPGSGDRLMYYPQAVTKLLCDWRLGPRLSASAVGMRVQPQRGYLGTAPARTGAYSLLNLNLVATLGLGHELRLEWRNVLDANPKVPMPGAPGVGTSMVPLAGRSVGLAYRRVFRP